MFELAVVGVVVAFSLILVAAGVVLLRIEAGVKGRGKGENAGPGVSVLSVFGMAAFILACLMNCAAVFLAYRLSVGIENFGGLFFLFALYAAVAISVFLTFYFIISTIKLLFVPRGGRA